MKVPSLPLSASRSQVAPPSDDDYSCWYSGASSSLSAVRFFVFSSEDTSGRILIIPIPATTSRKYGGGIREETLDLTPAASCCVPNHSSSVVIFRIPIPRGARSKQEQQCKGFHYIHERFFRGAYCISPCKMPPFSLCLSCAAAVLLLIKPTRNDAPDGSSARGQGRGLG